MTIKEYLTSHSLEEKTITKLGWVLDEKNERIVIPVYDIDGLNPFCRYRNLAEGADKFTVDKGNHPSLYCLHKVKVENTIVLCEGEPDCARLWQEGIPAVTSTSGVKTFKSNLAKPLANKKIVIVLDNDKAGQSSIKDYYKVLIEAGAYPSIKVLPREYKDICEYFTDGHTKEDFNKLPELTLEDYLDVNEPDEYGLETADDILAKQIDPERWLLDKMIPIEGICFFVGPEATAKSYHALCMANAIATGKSWLGKFECNKQTNVLIIDKENTQLRIQDRLRGLKITGKNLFWLKAPQKLEIADPESEDGYSDFIKAISRKVKKHNIGFIVVDSFTDLLTGDENDRKAIQDFIDAIGQLFPHISILFLHHAGKIMPGSRRPTSQMARGSTNIMAQCTTAFHTEPVRKSKTQFTIEQTKARDSQKMNKFVIELISEPDPKNLKETLVTDIVYVSEYKEMEEKIDEAIEIITDQINGANCTSLKELKESLVDSGEITNATFRRALDKMEEVGQIEKVRSSTIPNGKDILWKEKDVYTE